MNSKIEIFGFQRQNFPFVLHQNISSEHSEFYTNWHKEMEIVYTVSGSETIYIENDVFVTKPGDIVVINSGRVHTGTSTNWVHHCLIPSEDLLRSLDIDPTISLVSPHIRDTNIAELFTDIIAESQIKRKYDVQFKTLTVQRFFIQLYEKYETNRIQENRQKSDPNFLVTVKVIDYLRKHLNEDIPIDNIANDIGITPSYMCRCVKKATGISIIEHLNMLRCYAARHYLAHSDKKVNEVALLCGYQSKSYFAKTYQRILGYAPSETPKAK